MKIIGHAVNGNHLVELSEEELTALIRFCGGRYGAAKEIDIASQIHLVESLGEVTTSITFVKQALKEYIDSRFPEAAEQGSA